MKDLKLSELAVDVYGECEINIGRGSVGEYGLIEGEGNCGSL